MHVGGPGTAGVFSVWHHRKDHAVFAMQKRRFSYQNAPPIPAEGWAFLLRSSRGGVSRLLSIGREGFADPFRPSFFMANRENWAYDAQTETILASRVLCVLLAARTACTWRRNSPRCTTAAASYAETCCVPACPSGIIMVSFCKEVDPCEI